MEPWCTEVVIAAVQLHSKKPELCPVDTGHKCNVHKTFRRRPGHLLNVLLTFNLRPVSTGWFCEDLNTTRGESEICDGENL